MHGVGVARTCETYLAVLRPWFGFRSEHHYPCNARPEAVCEYTRLFLIEARCAVKAGHVDGWFVQATNRSPLSNSGLHLLIAVSTQLLLGHAAGCVRSPGPALPSAVRVREPDVPTVLLAWRAEHRSGSATSELPITQEFAPNRGPTRLGSRSGSSRSSASRSSQPSHATLSQHLWGSSPECGTLSTTRRCARRSPCASCWRAAPAFLRCSG
jgi:hypothetical protein